MRVPLGSSAGIIRRQRTLPPWLDRFFDSRLLLVIEIAALALMTASVVTRTWQDRVWLGFVLVGITALAWTPELFRVRIRRWWFAYVAGIFVYTLLRAFADETAIPVQYEYVIRMDRALFFGVDPVPWLQGKFFEPENIGFIDYLAVAVHWSFFVGPHAMAVGVFIFRREWFAKYTAIVVGTMWLGLVLFFLVPTAPPWLASVNGHLDGVYRVMDYVGGSVDRGTYEDFYASLGEPNSVAAMPSIHMGVTFAMALWAFDHARRWRWWLVAYTVIMGVALVYLGEHYVTDLLVGMVCAAIAYTFSKRIWREAPSLEHSPTRR